MCKGFLVLAFLTSFCALSFFGRAQNAVIVDATFNSTDTIVNYIRHPSLNAFNMRCLWNDSANCHLYTQGGSTICGSANSPEFRLFSNLSYSSLPSNLFLNGYGSILGFDNSWAMSMVASARSLSGSQPFNSTLVVGSSVWTSSPKNAVISGGIRTICPQHYHPLIDNIYSILNDSSTGSIDTVLPQIMSFDFVSGGTYFDLEYIFASDEYDSLIRDHLAEFPGWGFNFNPTFSQRFCEYTNDGVAIMISGNGVNGPYYNGAENIALLPNSTLPVTTRNIPPPNPSILGCANVTNANTNLLVSNLDTNTTFPFNGYTIPLSVHKIPINPCDTYRVHVIVGETGIYPSSSTQTLDYQSGYGASALIVKQHSARTGFWYPAPIQLYDGLGKDTLAEGCPGMILKLVRFTNINQPDSIQLSYTGSAENGIDVVTLPQWVYFNAGEDTTELQIVPLADNDVEGIENFIIRLLPPSSYPCPVDTTDVELWISDRPAFGAAMPDTFHFNPCTDSALQLSADTTFGLGPYLHVWSTGDTAESIVIVPDSSQLISLTVYDACFQDSVKLTSLVYVDFPRMDVVTADIDPSNCPGHSYTLTPEVSGGYPVYHFQWSTNQTSPSITVAPFESTTYFVSITDSCALDTLVKSFTVEVPVFDPLKIIGTSSYKFQCNIGLLNISTDAYLGSGGSGGNGANQSHYTFTWNNWINTDAHYEATVTKDTTLILQMTDTCGLDTATMPVLVDVFDGPFLTASLPDTLHACIGEEFTIVPDVKNGVPAYRYLWQNESTDSLLTFTPDRAKKDYSVTITDVCGFNQQVGTTVYATKPMADFNAVNDSYEPRTILFENRSKEAITYRWFFGDGGQSSESNPTYNYQDLEGWEVTLIATDTFGCDDQLTNPLSIPLNLFIPNAFSPNNDGQNETWQPMGYGFKSLGYTIFDRWGNAIFQVPETNNNIPAWDGRVGGELVPTGTYSYLILVDPYQEIKKEVKGQLTIIR